MDYYPVIILIMCELMPSNPLVVASGDVDLDPGLFVLGIAHEPGGLGDVGGSLLLAVDHVSDHNREDLIVSRGDVYN